MKITSILRKEVNAAVRANVRGANPLAEVGLRGEHWKPNALKWAADSDLGDLIRLALLKEIDDDERHPGCAELDLYVTTGINNRAGNGRELETNVCVLIRDGHVVGATSYGHEIAELKQRVSFPLGDWDEPQTFGSDDPLKQVCEGCGEPTHDGACVVEPLKDMDGTYYHAPKPDHDTRDREGYDAISPADYARTASDECPKCSRVGAGPLCKAHSTPTITLRTNRELTERGDYGVKRQLRTTSLSPAVYWSRNHNSYVAVRETDGTYRVLSINGIGEIRWSLDPAEAGRWQCDNDGDAAIRYFFEIDGGAL